jgi:hypothetical protein
MNDCPAPASCEDRPLQACNARQPLANLGCFSSFELLVLSGIHAIGEAGQSFFVSLMTILAMLNCIEYITPQHANRSTVQRLNVITGMSCKLLHSDPAVSTATAGMSLDDQVLLPDNYHGECIEDSIPSQIISPT